MISRKRLVLVLLIACLLSLVTSIIFYSYFERNEGPTSGLNFSVYPTINSAGVTVTYKGDDNKNNEAFIRFRVKGVGEWRNGHPLSPIRELKMLAGSIVYLEPNTEYELEITVQDPDGVENSTIHATFKTRSDSIPTGGGKTYYIAPDGDDENPGTLEKPWKSLNKVNELKPGDILYLREGKYYIDDQILLRVSGRSTAYITIRNYPGEKPVLYGSDKDILEGKISFTRYKGNVYYIPLSWRPVYVAQGTERLYHYLSLDDLLNKKVGVEGGWFYDPEAKRLYVATIDGYDPSQGGLHVSKPYIILRIYGRYIYITGLEIAYSYFGIIVSDNCAVENCVIHNVIVGVDTETGAKDCLIQNNTLWDTGIINWPWRMVKGTDAEGEGISLAYAGPGHVVRYNKIRGFFNGITASAWDGTLFNTSLIRDSDIHDNYILDVGDDGLEPEGSGINLRMWNNVIINSLCAVSLAPITYGPTYVFRNICINFTLLGVKLNSEYPSNGWKYLYHNTFYVSRTIMSSEWGSVQTVIGSSGAVYSRLVTRNNIFHLSIGNYIIIGTRKSCSLDYDNLFIRNETYSSLVTKNLEKNSISAYSEFINPESGDFRLKPNSPCIDSGTLIPNFNVDYYGKAPDMGAYEYRP